MWGVVLENKPNEKLIITQKHCVRILFGDYEAYMNKLSTCTRTTPYGCQKLWANFHRKEHTKPLLNNLKLLSVLPYPPILEKCAKGICLRNLLRSTQPNDRETVIEG